MSSLNITLKLVSVVASQTHAVCASWRVSLSKSTQGLPRQLWGSEKDILLTLPEFQIPRCFFDVWMLMGQLKKFP